MSKATIAFFLMFQIISILGVGTRANAEIKVQKFTPCEKLYFSMVKRIKSVGATHYAVATTGGRSLKSSGTGCGFDNGFDTRADMESSALRQCAIAKKRWGYPGRCRVIESR